jgi:hypothetical protein
MPFIVTYRDELEQAAHNVPHRKRNETLYTVSHGVPCSPTHEAKGSDQHRDCLPRLCCAYRLSQPLDALFHLMPFPPCFMRNTPLSFHFQRFSLSGSGDHFTAPLSFVPFPVASPTPANRNLRHRAATPRICAPAKSVSTSSVLPEVCRPILS